jgi:serine/threonine protein kinase
VERPARALPHVACVSENSLAAFADGQVDAEAQGRIEDHLVECSDCRRVFARTARAGNSQLDGSSVSSAIGTAMELSPGTHVGRYVIAARVGRGAMGVVYAANDPDLDRKVAVKVLRAESLSDAARQRMGARLLREAKAMARLSHPEVVTVYEVGIYADQLFVAMEYVDGETLRHWRAARHRGYAEILGVYERAGSGLAAAHEAGLVHRDFKPDNVLVGRDGRVRVTDFGLARSVSDVDVGTDAAHGTSSQGSESTQGHALVTSLTHTGTLLGTPAYMAPEQLRAGVADARSDVFGFCVALYEALYGERPFAGSTVPELMAAIDGGTVRAAPVMTGVPRWVRAVLLRGLRAAPDARFESMRGLLDALRAGYARSRRRKGSVVGVAAGALLLVGALCARGRGAAALREAPASSVTAVSAESAKSGGTAASGDMASTRGADPPGGVAPPAAILPPTPPPSSSASPAPAPHTGVAAVPAARSLAVPVAGRPPVARRGAPRVGSNGALILED